MTTHGLVFAIVGGAALLALWLDQRRAGRMPQAARSVFAHSGVAFALLIVAPLLMALTHTKDSPPRAIAGLFLLVLPSFVYTFLTWIWLVRLLQRYLRLG